MLEPNTNDTLGIEEIDWRYATRARYIHLTSFVGERPFLAQKALVEQVQPSNRITFDPGEVYARRGLEALRPLVEKSYVIFATDREIKRLTGLDFDSGSKRLLEMGPSIIACKRGPGGVHVLSHQDRISLPTEAVDVVDQLPAIYKLFLFRL